MQWAKETADTGGKLATGLKGILRSRSWVETSVSERPLCTPAKPVRTSFRDRALPRKYYARRKSRRSTVPAHRERNLDSPLIDVPGPLRFYLPRFKTKFL